MSNNQVVSKHRHINLDAQDELKQLALNIKIARKRRKITLDEMAKRTGVSLSTISRLELADPTVALGIILQVLSVLGLVRGLSSLAASENDVVQVLDEIRGLRVEKVRRSKKTFSDEDINF